MAERNVLTVVKGSEGISLQYTREHVAALQTADDFLASFSDDPAQVILMNPAGSQLHGDRLDSLLSALADRPALDPMSTGETLYAFDRRYLSMPAADAYAALGVVLEDVVEHDPPSVDATGPHRDLVSAGDGFHRIAVSHHDTSLSLLAHIRGLKASLTVALANLARSVEGQKEVLETFDTFAQGSVEECGTLLAAYEPALALAKKVRLHPAVLAASTTGGSSTRSKFMIDFVLEDKMAAIQSACAKVYAQLRAQSDSVREAAERITSGMSAMTETVQGPAGDIDDLVELEADVHDGLARADHAVSVVAEAQDADELASLFQELGVLDEDARERIGFLVERKNYWIQLVIAALNDISSMQASLPRIRDDVQSMDDGLRNRTVSFRHLGRLRELVLAYAAMIVEIVRRKEFAHHFADHSAAMAGLMGRLSSEEEKRRRSYRSEQGGRMPFEVAPLEDTTVQTAEVAVKAARSGDGKGDDLPALTRSDIDEFLANLQQIEGEAGLAQGPAKEVRLFVERQMVKLEAMENAFASAAERTVVSASQLLATSHRSVHDAALADQLRTDVASLEAEVSTLRRQLVDEAGDHGTTRAAYQEALDQISAMQNQIVEASERRLSTEDAVVREQTAKAAAQARTEELEATVADRTRAVAESERQLTSARATAADATKELQELQARHANHLSDHSTLEWSLERARERIDQLTDEADRAASRNRELTEKVVEREKELREQRSEAECDRAVLENEVKRLKEAALGSEERARSATEREAAQKATTQQAVDSATTLLRAQLRDVEVKQSAESAAMASKAAMALSSAQRLRLAQDRVLARLAAMPAPSASHRKSTSDLQTISEDFDAPSAPSPAFDALLAELQAVDVDAFGGTVQKKADGLSQMVRKWMKESKGYRERAKSAQEQARTKITVQEFGAGDLALFLPTRNSTARVWAAFNVSFPHYFLRPTDRVAELTKPREWLVARISALEGRVVDPKAPDSNPYSLPEGTQYYLLDIDGPYIPERTPRKSPSPPKAESPPKLARSQPGPPQPTPPRTKDLSQSDFTVIEPSSPADSPFVSAGRPSALSISIARSKQPPPLPEPVSSVTGDQYHRDSGPAFLPRSEGPRPLKPPSVAGSIAPPTRQRPVPRATDVSRAGSRPSSVASSIRPSIAALIKPGSSPGRTSTSAAIDVAGALFSIDPPSPGLSSSFLGSWRRRKPSAQGATELLRKFSS